MTLRTRMARLRPAARLDNIERIYLAALRVAALVLATICLLAAVWFAADAAWRIFVSTDVETAQTTVAPEEVAALMATTPLTSGGETEATIPASVRNAHAAFVRDVFPRYHAVYQAAARAFGKAEDEILGAEELLAELGYDLETYASGEYSVATLFVENASYQEQAQAAVAASMSAAPTRTLLTQYRDAEREERCATRTVTRRVSQICGYYYTYDCSYTERRPVRECEMVYPDGIVSPLEAFRRSDAAFAELWMNRTEENQRAAAAERAQRQMTRAEIGPKFMLALWVLGGFLTVMFFFLIVAIERHLRRLSTLNPPEDAPTEPTA